MKNSFKFKKILVISHNPLSQHSNNGKTLAAVFKDWPVDCFAQLYFSGGLPESQKFNNFFRITDIGLLKSVLKFGYLNTCGSQVNAIKNVNDTLNLKQRNIFWQNLANKFTSVKRLLRDALFSSGLWNSEKLQSWTNNYAPEVIFLLGGDACFAFDIGLALASKYQIPLFVYITDDYLPDTLKRSFIKLYLDKKLRNKYVEVFSVSAKKYVIGVEMAEVFAHRFQSEFFPLMNCVDFVKFEVSEARQNKKILEVVYAGGLHLGRDLALCEFARVLIDVSESTGVLLILKIYSLDQPKREITKRFIALNIIFAGGALSTDLQIIFSKSDFLLHIESSNPDLIEKTKLSISTKIPEYLSVGVCLIAVGPEELASIKLIAVNGIGLIISNKLDIKKQLSDFSQAVLNDSYRISMGSAGREYANMHFSGAEVRKKLYLQICGENNVQ